MPDPDVAAELSSLSTDALVALSKSWLTWRAVGGGKGRGAAVPSIDKLDTLCELVGVCGF